MMEGRTKQEQLARLGELAEQVGIPLFIRIAQVVCIARQKHPDWHKSHEYAVRIVKSEMLEWESQAMLVEQSSGRVDPARVLKTETESLHVIGTLIRYLSGDYKQATEEEVNNAV